jgi:hypothetical protein
MKNRNNILLITGLLCLVAALLLLVSCNPVKKVLRNPKLTEQVVAEWRQDHPLETARVVIPGRDTVIVKERVKYDSIRLPYPVNHRYTEIRYLDRLVTDTVYIRDTAMIGILIRKVESLERVILNQEAKIKELRGFKTGVIFLAILAVVIGVIAVLRRFKLF